MADPTSKPAPTGAAGPKLPKARNRALMPLRAKTRFLRDEAGAITADWLALSLVIAGMVVAFIAYFTPLLEAGASGIF